MRQLFDFPLYVGTPERRPVNSLKELIKLIDKYNGIKPIYNCIYGINNRLTKVFFDFDGEQALQDVIKLDAWCEKHNLKRMIAFSGMKGFHFYIFTKNYDNVKLIKDALFNAHKHICKQLGNGFNPDPQIIGNITQSGRIPNTFHLMGKRYCIAVTRRDLEKGIGHIKELAQKQRFGNFIVGEELLDISEFDKKSIRRRASSGEMKTFDYKLEVNDRMLKHFPPCIQQWLLQPKEYCKNRTRYFFALACKGLALPAETCKSLAFKYWSGVRESGGMRSKYQEFINEKQIDYAYRSDNCVPNCSVMFELGYCSGKCNKFKENNFPIYED